METEMKVKSSFTVLLIVTLFLMVILSTNGCSYEKKSDIQARVDSVENSLRLACFIKGEPLARLNILDRMKHYNIPGLSLAVINNGRIEWARGYGVKETGGTDSVTTETLFQAASISKPVAALGMLHLVDQGKIELDEPINKKLKSWKVPENEFTVKEKVTLRRLLTHSAGLTVHGFPGYAATEEVPTLIQVINGEGPTNTDPIKVDILPGSQWRYSGGGFTLAQLLTGDVSEKSFHKYMREAVLIPADMANSTYEQPLPANRAADAASAHQADGSLIEGKWHTYPEKAAAGLWTTPTDLCCFAIELQKSAAGKSNKIISKETADKMLTPGIGNWGLGLGISGKGETKSFSHGGSNKGYICELFAYVNGGKGAAVMTNSDSGGDLAGEILRSISAVYGWADYKPKEVTIAKSKTKKTKKDE